MDEASASGGAKKINQPGPSKGGEARARKLSKEQRREIAKKAAQARWAKKKQASDGGEKAGQLVVPSQIKQASDGDEIMPSKTLQFPKLETSREQDLNRPGAEGGGLTLNLAEAKGCELTLNLPEMGELEFRLPEAEKEVTYKLQLGSDDSQRSPQEILDWPSPGLLLTGSSKGEERRLPVVVDPMDIDDSVQDEQQLPSALYAGYLDLMGAEVPCYVLSSGQRIIGRNAANALLTGRKDGNFERTIGVESLQPFLDVESIVNQLVPFRLSEVEGLKKNVKGLPADLLVDVCGAYVAALQDSYNRPSDAQYPQLTARQREIAVKASMFLASVAKVGLDALIDEATGYQEFRAKDALEVKLRAYLETEMRKWEKTFPDELWQEFGRLTNWQGKLHQRPKYWGKLVMELVYEYLDPDVAQWLRDNAPKPTHGKNYHQWLSSQYGLKRLIEHVWMLIGMAKSCDDMKELKQKMRDSFGNDPVQLSLKIPRKPLND